jgi:hypothetical protein
MLVIPHGSGKLAGNLAEYSKKFALKTTKIKVVFTDDERYMILFAF